MATELDAIINSDFFKATTDGLTGNYTVRIENGQVVYQQDPSEPETAYGSLENLFQIGIPLTGGDVTQDATYIDLTATSLWADGQSLNTTIDAPNGTITVNTGGTYYLDSFVNVAADVASADIAIKYDVNGVKSTRYLYSTTKSAGGTNNMAGSSLATLNSGDVIKLAIASDTTCTATVKSAGINLVKIDNT